MAKKRRKIHKKMSAAQFRRICGIVKQVENDINRKLRNFKG